MPIYQLVLPSMGESVSEATITQWLKKVGDTIAADEAVVEAVSYTHLTLPTILLV